MSWVSVEKARPYSLLSLVLAGMVFVTAILIVYYSNKSRNLFTEYYKLQVIEQKHQDERARLLLQKSSDGTLYKIISKASSKLQMYIPAVRERLYIP